MRTTTFILNHLLPLDAVHLGSLVGHVQEPEQEFHRPLAPPEDRILIDRRIQLDLTHFRTKGFQLKTAIARLVSIGSENYNQSNMGIVADSVTTYKLKNVTEWFKNICAIVDTRKWFEENIELGNDIYLVVGICTLTNACITESQDSRKEMSGSLAIDMSSVAIPGSNLGPGALKLEVSDNHVSQKLSQGVSLIAPGEKIFGVQYRKIKFSWFSSRKIEKAFLHSQNRWKTYWSDRTEDDGEDDVVEAELGDPLSKEDLEEIGEDCELDESLDGEEEFLCAPCLEC